MLVIKRGEEEEVCGWKVWFLAIDSFQCYNTTAAVIDPSTRLPPFSLRLWSPSTSLSLADSLARSHGFFLLVFTHFGSILPRSPVFPSASFNIFLFLADPSLLFHLKFAPFFSPRIALSFLFIAAKPLPIQLRLTLLIPWDHIPPSSSHFFYLPFCPISLKSVCCVLLCSIFFSHSHSFLFSSSFFPPWFSHLSHPSLSLQIFLSFLPPPQVISGPGPGPRWVGEVSLWTVTVIDISGDGSWDPENLFASWISEFFLSLLLWSGLCRALV